MQGDSSSASFERVGQDLPSTRGQGVGSIKGVGMGHARNMPFIQTIGRLGSAGPGPISRPPASGARGGGVDAPPAHAIVQALVLNGRPTLLLGGELGNSTASEVRVLAESLDRCREMNLNVVLLPVYWDRTEPEEGRYDFDLLDAAIRMGRERNLGLILLWFGTWKNCMSCYAPAWMKRDGERFPRVRLRDGTAQEMISPLSTEAMTCDARAFSAVMNRVKQLDPVAETVWMIQVENEIGMIPEARDDSALARRAWAGAVPEMLMDHLRGGECDERVIDLWHGQGDRMSGSWAEVFGSSEAAEEVFTAWHVARYTEHVARAGKEVWPLPMFVNAALIRPGYRAGQYASGGPLPHSLKLWRYAAPSIDLLTPDIYFPNFCEWAERYPRAEQGLLIPEMAASARACGNLVWSIGALGAMGVAPFAIESVNAERAAEITSCYGMLKGMSDLIMWAHARGSIRAMSPRVDFDWRVIGAEATAEIFGIKLTSTFDRHGGGSSEISELPTLGSGRWDAPPGVPLGAVLVIGLGEDEFLMAGCGATVRFEDASGGSQIGLDWVQEGHWRGPSSEPSAAGSDQNEWSRLGAWEGGRWLNGDQTHQGRHVNFPMGSWSQQRVKIYRYR